MFLISGNLDTLTGMRLAGVEGTLANTPAQINTALREAGKDSSIGIILITEKLAAMCPETMSEFKSQNREQLIIEIPDRHGTGRAPDSITRYVREAIGIRI